MTNTKAAASHSHHCRMTLTAGEGAGKTKMKMLAWLLKLDVMKGWRKTVRSGPANRIVIVIALDH